MIKHLKLRVIQKNDSYQRGLASMVYKFLIKSRKEVVLLMNQIIN